MIKKSYSTFVRFILFIVQFSGILLAIILEYLAPQKMGVARYLVYKKEVLSATLFTPILLQIYTFVLVSGLIACLLRLIFIAKKGRLTLPILLAVIYNAIGILLISTQNLHAYHFFAFGIFFVLIFQYAKIIILTLGEK